ncbi:site-specific integrase [Streptomyces lydicus]|uniref:site-specific integrase n=1 Tax=Streptomyces lydicus TaxID=47763 RepID=UPI001F5078AD|nr:site-specific integrase [Streptomyces lydicus]MCZ1006521.1 site-specific integrase [Streptomyces lydicus]
MRQPKKSQVHAAFAARFTPRLAARRRRSPGLACWSARPPAQATEPYRAVHAQWGTVFAHLPGPARLKEALGRAVTRRLLSVNVAEHVTIPRKARKEERKNKQEVMPWNVQEVQTFVHGVMEERLYAPLLLSLMGLRPAEVCGLRWTDVDLDDASITIANTRTMRGNRYVVEKDTKSTAGERELPLPALVLAALTSFKALQAKEKLALGEAYVASGYVLVHETGEAFAIKQLRRRAYRLMDMLALRRVRVYDARASCSTFLANKGMPDHILARWAGHTNVKTTKRWYVKADVEDLREAATPWDGLHGASTQHVRDCEI